MHSVRARVRVNRNSNIADLQVIYRNRLPVVCPMRRRGRRAAASHISAGSHRSPYYRPLLFSDRPSVGHKNRINYSNREQIFYYN